MNVLLIGGTGIISYEVCLACLDKGFNVTIVNRGKHKREIPVNVNVIIADIRNESEADLLQKFSGCDFDVVIDFISYNIHQMLKTIHCLNFKQYIFISSATIYKEKEEHKYVEDDPKENDGWDYCIKKRLCECELQKQSKERDFYYTIVRPYVTYDNNRFPYQISPLDYYTIVHRIKNNMRIPICGLNSKTTLTHSKDFAIGLVGLIDNSSAYNEDFHITSDSLVKWADVAEELARCYGTHCHFVDFDKSYLINQKNTVINIAEILADKSRQMMFDNSKIKKAIPDFSADRNIAQSINGIYNYFENYSNKKINYLWSGCLDRMIKDYSGEKISYKAYPDASIQDLIMYWIGKCSAACYIYMFLIKIYHILKK